MLSPHSFHDIKDRIQSNEEKINLLHAINNVLKDRHDIEANFKNLSLKFTKFQKEEAERREKFDQSRKHNLSEMENKGSELCKEHSRLLHQIEHITWHLDGCTRHRPCLGRLPENCPKKLPQSTSCISSATSCNINRPSVMANLKNSSERLIKGIVDLRKKIYMVHEKLEHEVKRKKDMEKKLSELRRDISRQKKSLSTRRTTPLPSIASSMSPGKKSMTAK